MSEDGSPTGGEGSRTSDDRSRADDRSRTTDDPRKQCEYVFDPEEWEAERDSPAQLTSEDLNDEGVWRCPHETEPSREFCLFHLPPEEKSEAAVADALVARIERPGKADKQFVGARFGALDLSNVRLESESNHPIDFRHAEFEGRLALTNAVVRQSLTLDGATFHEVADFTEVEFESELYCSRATFRDEGRFHGAELTRGGWFYATAFGDAEFSMATFGDRADFREARFEHTHFRETTFEEQAEFHEATFDHAMFSGARFEDLTYFDRATFPARANFRHARFEEKASFEDPRPADESSYLDLRDATVARGSLSQPSDATVLYDLENATVGDVTLGDGLETDLLRNYRFVGTTFEGFDFGRYYASLAATDWRLHEFDPVPGFGAERAPELSPVVLENTYLKAKRGADATNAVDAADEFFQKEMYYRRRQHAAGMGSDHAVGSRLAAAFRWSANVLFDLTSGYGERPSRTILSSLGVVLAFAGVYALAWPTQAYDHPAGTLVLSFESFVGVFLGGAARVEDPWIRLLAAVEGFAGAFFISLFVFALTRSLHRSR